jgi:hypothetical protein
VGVSINALLRQCIPRDVIWKSRQKPSGGAAINGSVQGFASQTAPANEV